MDFTTLGFRRGATERLEVGKMENIWMCRSLEKFQCFKFVYLLLLSVEKGVRGGGSWV